MSIPIDNLYHYIENITQEIYNDPIVIYRFCPHGSKKIEDLHILNIKHNQLSTLISSPAIYCYDQEPLNFDLYTTSLVTTKYQDSLTKYQITDRPYNLDAGKLRNIYDNCILIHSEQRSENLTRYTQNAFIPVYYWSHAVIALDWFRYAQHVKQHKQVTKTFLIYNRAWSGTREYRLRFAELLILLELQNDCQTTVNPIEPELGIHYEMHQFGNTVWRPQTVLENYFPAGTADSNYSAVVDINDYEATDIEVVLETLFDDGRLQLTEKTLRPIACGQPFILASTAGSLEYLRSYGFKTFSDVWSEAYDTVEDSEERMYTITDLMNQIANWGPHQRENKMAQARAIAEYNRKHFFSKEFFDLVTGELKTNLKSALEQLENTNTSQSWCAVRTQLIRHPEHRKTRQFNGITRDETAKIIRKARSYLRRK